MWFKSKLQSPDPEIRRKHLEHLDPQDEMLIEIARTDPHPDVRADALTRIVDLATLKELARADADQRIRKQATARLQTLLVGGEESLPPLERRLEFLESSSDERLFHFVVRSGHEPALRKVALSKLLLRQEDAVVQDLLCVIAAEDAVQEIRQAAAQPLQDKKRLQSLLEKSRDRDKSIHRLARERLDKIEQQRLAQETLEKCCLDIEQLNEHHFSADGKTEEARLARIVADWEKTAAQIDSIDEKLEASFAAARKAIDLQLANIVDQRRKRTEILDALNVHLTDAAGEPVAELIRRWHDLDEPAPQQAREFAKLITQVTEHDSQRDRDNHRIVAKQGLLTKMQQASETATLRKTVLARLEERWDSAPDPEDESTKTELNEKFLSLREKLRAKLEKQERLVDEGIAKIASLLNDYMSALDEGKLQIASSAHDKINHLLASLEAPQERKYTLVKKLRSGEPRMAELKRWRHWGTEKKREELCEHIESLVPSEMKISAVAKSVRESREAWKALDKSDGPSSRKLWRRFDSACEKAYAPCQAHFEQQKAQRKENMTRRVAICTELEELYKATDWDAPPWRELTDALREKERSWHGAGSVDRRERTAIQSRYEKAVAAIDEHLNAKRLAEIERRESLIGQVESLVTSEDTARATDTAKRAQREWKPVVQSGRRKEQDLWKRFRAACDTIFENRKEQFAAADNERMQNLGEKLAVCGQVEEIAGQLKTHVDSSTVAAEEINSARNKVRQLASGWQRIGQVPRDKQQSIEKQFNRGCKEIEQLCAQLEKRFKEQARSELRKASTDCDELELAVATGQSIETDAIEQIESRVQTLPAAAAIVRRLQRLQAAASGDATALKEISSALPANLETRLRLCLELEIAANIESPDEFKEDRMQYRVKLLSESMSGHRERMSPAQLEALWYETGPVLEAERVKLEQRFNRVLKALRDD